MRVCFGNRLGDGPLVVLAEEDDRGVERRGVDEGLVDVALRGRTVTEVADDRGVALGVAGADVAVHLDAHGVARGVQGLGADDDGVEVEVVLLRVPPALADAAEELQRTLRVHAAHEADAVLPIGGEAHVVRLQRATGADLGRLLAEQAGPQSELALTLEGVSLGIEAADEDEVAVEAAQVVRREVRDVLVVVGVGQTLDPRGSAAGSCPGHRRRPRGSAPAARRQPCRSLGLLHRWSPAFSFGPQTGVSRSSASGVARPPFVTTDTCLVLEPELTGDPCESHNAGRTSRGRAGRPLVVGPVSQPVTDRGGGGDSRRRPPASRGPA